MNMTRIRAIVVLIILAGSAATASSQTTPAPTTPLDNLRTGTSEDIQDTPGRRLGLADGLDYLAVLARQKSTLLRLLVQYEEERSDEQIGAGASAPGTTTLVSKGTVPKILGLAVENGALVRSQSATTVTFRGNLGGSIRALAGKGLFQLKPGDDPSLSILSHASFSASFDTSRGATEADKAGQTFTGDSKQLSQWTFRWQVANRRDPQGPNAIERWRQQITDSQVGVSRAALALNQAFENDPAIAKWLEDAALAVDAAKTAAAMKTRDAAIVDIVNVMKAHESQFPAAETLRAETLAALDEWDRSTTAFVSERHALLQDLKSGLLASLEFTNDRPVKAPHTSNLRLVGEVGGTVDLTGNASMTFFDGNIPPGATRQIRDLQFSGEIDIKMGSADTVGAFALAVSGKYINQLENSYSDAGIVIPNTKGTTAIAQVKLTIPAKGTGVKIPLSLTFANRTDLIKESIVRANVGVTYDLDSVFAKFRP
jgi:hypothetical protein